MILYPEIKIQKIAPGVNRQLIQAGFVPKFCHFQNSWLVPCAQYQVKAKTAQQIGSSLPVS